MTGLLACLTTLAFAGAAASPEALAPQVVDAVPMSGTVEGPALPSAGLETTETHAEADQLQLRPRRESDAYVETAVAASAAVLTSVDGGERDPLAPETLADLAIRAGAASLSTASNVALVRAGATRTVDLAAVWVPNSGAGMVMTMRF